MSNKEDNKVNGWITDLIKLSPKYLLAISIFTGLILCLGFSDILETFGLGQMYEDYKNYFALLFLASVSFLFAHFFWWVFMSIKARFSANSNLKFAKKRLKNLTDREKEILQPYIFKDLRHRQLSISDGTVKELALIGIIFRSSNISSGGLYFSYNLQPWAREYLSKHSNLLEITVDKIL